MAICFAAVAAKTLVQEKVEAQKQENAASSESPDGPYAGSDLVTGESSGDESASQSSDEIFDADKHALF